MYREKAQHGNQNPHISVDCVIFGFDAGDLKVLLIERNSSENKKTSSDNSNDLLLPGDLIYDDEDLDTAAKRVLKELTGLDNIYLEQFYTFGDPNRVKKKGDEEWLKAVRPDPKARVITIAYYSLVKLGDYQPSASSFAKKADWYSIKTTPQLGFDHNEILTKALNTLKRRLLSHHVGIEMLPQKFTLGQLQILYETILDKKLDKRNFRRQIMKKGLIISLSEKQQDVPHKRASLYSFDREKFDKLNEEFNV